MLRRVILVALTGVGLVLSVGVPAEAATFCMDDPAVTISAPNMAPVTVWVTEVAQDPQNLPSLHASRIRYTVNPTSYPNVFAVSMYDLVPTGQYGKFQTWMAVTTLANGGGEMYGWSTGYSDNEMAVSFYLGHESGSESD
jgi:hypothetical protein